MKEKPTFTLGGGLNELYGVVQGGLLLMKWGGIGEVASWSWGVVLAPTLFCFSLGMLILSVILWPGVRK